MSARPQYHIAGSPPASRTPVRVVLGYLPKSSRRSILTIYATGRHNHHLLPRPQLAPLQDPPTTRDIRNHRRHHPRPLRHGPHSRLPNLHLPNRVHDQPEPSRQPRADAIPLHHRIGSRSALLAQQLAACAECWTREYGGAVWTGLCDCGGVVQ